MRFLRKKNCAKYAIGVTGLLYLLQLTVLPIAHIVLHLEDPDQHLEKCELEHSHPTHLESDCDGPCQNPDHDHDRHGHSSHDSENCNVCKTLVFATVAKEFRRHTDVKHAVTGFHIDDQLLISQILQYHSLSRAPPVSLS